MSKPTPGPWAVEVMPSGRTTVTAGSFFVAGNDCDYGLLDDNARLIAAAPELLAAVESEYIFLADIHNEWPGRHTAEGQMKLCRLRDLICKATGREGQDVQDDYGNRNLAKAEVQS